MPKPNWRIAEKAASVIFLILILGLWETGFRLNWWNSYLFPGPSEVFTTLVDGLRDGGGHTEFQRVLGSSLLLAVRISLVRLLAGFGVALIGGTALGLLMGAIPPIYRAIGPLALGLQTLPSVCWLPLAVVWFGMSERAIMFVTMMGALLAVTISVSDGIRNVSPVYLRAARMMGATGPRLYAEVMLPAAFPAIISGAKQGWAFAWRSLMAGELLSVSAGAIGLGQTLNKGRDLNDMSLVLAVMLVLILIGVVADRLLFTKLENSVRLRWGLAVS